MLVKPLLNLNAAILLLSCLPALLSLGNMIIIKNKAVLVGNLNINIVYNLYCVAKGNGTPLQYSCLENPMDGGAWQGIVHGVAKSQTWLSD